ALVRELAARRGLVIATGGGTLVDPRNAGLLRAGGLIVVLRARPETVAARLFDPEERPLLAGYRGPELVARIRELLAQRKAAYEAADLTVDTDDLGPGEVAALIVQFVRGGAAGGTESHG
ncbi:MAG: shikimate kinase, partial [Firmicutes bacterium]|nr:shikimate kinase [Bacillota bacterium]